MVNFVKIGILKFLAYNWFTDHLSSIHSVTGTIVFFFFFNDITNKNKLCLSAYKIKMGLLY